GLQQLLGQPLELGAKFDQPGVVFGVGVDTFVQVVGLGRDFGDGLLLLADDVFVGVAGILRERRSGQQRRSQEDEEYGDAPDEDYRHGPGCPVVVPRNPKSVSLIVAASSRGKQHATAESYLR